jgi:hypothetical protein
MQSAMCAQVIHPRLGRRHLTDAIGEPGPPPVELDHAREGGESVEEGHPERLLPGCLEIADESVHEDEVDRAGP